METGLIARQPVDPLAHLLVGALDEAAMYISRAADTEAARREMGESIERMLEGLRALGCRGLDAYRTPDERFENLPDFPWEPRYRDVDGLRMAHVEDGDGPPVVMFHGEPTWSFLWRKVLPPVRDAGYRVILPDLVGFGRSDKPTDFDWYSYERHCRVRRHPLRGPRPARRDGRRARLGRRRSGCASRSRTPSGCRRSS